MKTKTKTATKTTKHKKPAKPLTKAQKRVLIAKDVLKTLAFKKKSVIVQTGSYCKFNKSVDDAYTDAVGQDFQKLLPKLITNQAPCAVCAQGALFLSHVRLFDKVDVSFPEYGWNDGMPMVKVSDLQEPLHLTFSKEQLALIESAFEQTDRSCANNAEQYDKYDIKHGYPHPQIQEAVEFGNKHDDPRKRLKAIVQNIITNKGTFKP